MPRLPINALVEYFLVLLVVPVLSCTATFLTSYPSTVNSYLDGRKCRHPPTSPESHAGLCLNINQVSLWGGPEQPRARFGPLR